MSQGILRPTRWFTALLATALAVSPAVPQELIYSNRYTTYGTVGLIDMPTAESAPDAELAFTTSHFHNQTRNTLTFQATPRLSASFRYSLLYDVRPYPGSEIADFRFDRSFSMRYQLREESGVWPAFAVGLDDFFGTGFYSSEYLVATKSFGENLRVTTGLGWGRLGSYAGFDNPLSAIDDRFETRPDRDTGFGGEIETAQWFRGDAAFFGGLAWQINDRLLFEAEYSSDDYVREDGAAFEKRSPFNFGATYEIKPGISLSAHYLYGSELGAQLTFTLNPAIPPVEGGLDRAPVPVAHRDVPTSWQGYVSSPEATTTRTAALLESEGIRLHGLQVDANVARIEIENERYPTSAQAIGRTARVLTNTLPPYVTTFVIVPVEQGLPASAVTLQRRDLEEFDTAAKGAFRTYARAEIGPASGLSPLDARYPDFGWEISPYIATSIFDPDAPVRADLGVELEAEYEPVTGVLLSGAVRKRLVGNLSDSTRDSTSELPRVRSEANLYAREGDPAITGLTAGYYFKPGTNLYGRVTAGYLESMFGGVSTELLWKPVDSAFALGVETNYVRQRDFDQMFGFRDYDVVTGHVSGYWDIGNGFHTQLDVGRYLAGDWGATLAVDREFDNGWKVGAFATLTDVPFDEFGEGSFDKGIRLTIPLSWVSGRPRKDEFETTIRPVLRDGGARLNVEDRLYETVRDHHRPELFDGWGRFWK